MANRLQRFELKLARRDSKLARRRADGMAGREVRNGKETAKVAARVAARSGR